jgi:hypothetical protein
MSPRAFALLWRVLLPLTAAPSPLARGAEQARQTCFRLVDDDLFEFARCVDGLVKSAAGARPEQAARRLGVLYFGWVGALSGERLSMPGSTEAARRFRLAFREEQRRQRVTDAALCAVVEGDCKTRLAILQEAEAAEAVDAGAHAATH